MAFASHGTKNLKREHGVGWNLLHAALLLVVLVGAATFIFVRAYSSYTDKVVYDERLGQMQEVTEQLFTGLEDVVENQWYNAGIQAGRLSVESPSTKNELLSFLQSQAELSEFDSLNANLVVVDSRGRYYTQAGERGLLAEMGYLASSPERESFVSSSVTKERTYMFFLVQLDAPIEVQDGDRTLSLTYCGIARDMVELNQYFTCKAYEGNNAVYVLDRQGSKLFSEKVGTNPLGGFNAYTVLRDADYLHGSSFDDAQKVLNQTGVSYSNAILNGKEYYYSLYHMANAEWTMLFIVPSSAVAVSTVDLVNSTTEVVLTFAVIMILVCGALIYWILQRQQKRALALAQETNDVLEANNKRLREAQATAQEALRKAESASSAKSNFLANMSHDIRTPMNAIVGITNLMEHEKDNPGKIDAYIHKIQASSQHLLSLINDVLDMSKIESSDVALNREPVSLAEQIGQVESIIRPQVDDREQNFTIRTHAIAHEFLVGDAVRLRQVFINLLSNAVKYTPYGGSVVLELSEIPSEKPGYAKFLIAVTDNGYGMTSEFMSHLFEPFVRAENSTTNKVQGTGLGMAITKSIVDMMDGTITVQSKPNVGSRFEVTLTMEIDSSVSLDLPCRRVLVISDESDFIENVQAALSVKDVDVCIAASSEQADAYLGSESIDVALLGGTLQGQILADHILDLRAKAQGVLLFYCCDGAGENQLGNIAEKNGIDAVLARPIFLSNLINAIDRVSGNVAVEDESVSVLDGMRFLCAEDNALNAEILEAIMDMNNAHCTIYPNGARLVEAFEQVAPGEYDAILMDVQMPVMNGLDAARAVRKSKNALGAAIPIIAMTANAFSEDVQDCLNAGMDAHVSKPLSIAALERALKSVLNAKNSGGGDTPLC